MKQTLVAIVGLVCVAALIGFGLSRPRKAEQDPLAATRAITRATKALSTREEAVATRNSDENWAGLAKERTILAEALRTSAQYAEPDSVEKAQFEIQMADAILAKRPPANKYAGAPPAR